MTLRAFYQRVFVCLLLGLSPLAAKRVYATSAPQPVSSVQTDKTPVPRPVKGDPLAIEAKDDFSKGFRQVGRGFKKGTRATGKAFQTAGKVVGRSFKKVGVSLKNVFSGPKEDISERDLSSPSSELDSVGNDIAESPVSKQWVQEPRRSSLAFE